ncbi:phenylacetate--CoA ligase family protein [Kineosporia babensis]|uniref:AMP-dependent ligase C-terminal domain-containing protein n=1 Tax=Kineosporia babensis TaxID=499548 RepID=A0A9X1NKZ5_9ACTN|nr:hypothetical protein [Kineosporia babensis]MCD5315704.1 hypothetical protein [Kineosporia babensis]
MPRAEREARVLERVQQQLHYVYENLPFYRQHYDAHGFRPEQVRSLADFTARVPVITKAMLRDDQVLHPPFGSYLGVDRDQVVRVHGSSGTTGKPTLYAFSAADWEHTAQVMGRAFAVAGVGPQDTAQLATVFSLFMGGWGALLGCQRVGAGAFPIGAGETERQIELMYRVGSTVLVTTPTYALHMLEVARTLGYDTTRSPLRLGIFIGEPGAAIPATRRVLADGWGIDVRDMATTSEMTPWATNVECSAGAGVHVLQDEVWTEIVDKNDSSVPAAEGVSGGVVYTHLHRDSQPMIRFYSGDESHMTYEPCSCGRSYPRLPQGIYGRLDDMLIIRGANVYPSQVQRVLLEVPGTGVEFVIVLERQQSLDRALVRVEHDPSWPADTPALREDLAGRVRRKLKLETNIHFDVEILAPNTLERAVSKARRVHDLREAGRLSAATP